jgi:hypothetical protein
MIFLSKKKKRLLFWIITVKIPIYQKISVWWRDDHEHKTNEREKPKISGN